MNTSRVGGILLAGFIVACIAFTVALFLIKAIWAWTVPDLFPGAVEQGLIARSISWFTAGKIAILIAILSSLASGHRSVHRE